MEIEIECGPIHETVKASSPEAAFRRLVKESGLKELPALARFRIWRPRASGKVVWNYQSVVALLDQGDAG